jgi:hypothetical protein
MKRDHHHHWKCSYHAQATKPLKTLKSFQTFSIVEMGFLVFFKMPCHVGNIRIDLSLIIEFYQKRKVWRVDGYEE